MKIQSMKGALLHISFLIYMSVIKSLDISKFLDHIHLY